MQKLVVIGVGTFGTAVVNTIAARDTRSVKLVAVSEKSADFKHCSGQVTTVLAKPDKIAGKYLGNIDFLKGNGASLIIVVGSSAGISGKAYIPYVCDYLDAENASFAIMLSMPFLFEGKKRMGWALENISVLSRWHHLLMLTSSDAVLGANTSISVSEAFRICENAYADAVLEMLHDESAKALLDGLNSFRQSLSLHLPDTSLRC